MLKDKIKGIWIPAEIILDHNLSDKEKKAKMLPISVLFKARKL